jgi:hypothetical protein
MSTIILYKLNFSFLCNMAIAVYPDGVGWIREQSRHCLYYCITVLIQVVQFMDDAGMTRTPV